MHHSWARVEKHMYIFIYIFYNIHFCPKVLRWPRTLKVFNTLCTTGFWADSISQLFQVLLSDNGHGKKPSTRIKPTPSSLFLFTRSSSVTPQLQHVWMRKNDISLTHDPPEFSFRIFASSVFFWIVGIQLSLSFPNHLNYILNIH